MTSLPYIQHHSPYTTLVPIQLTGVFALGYLFFGVGLPAVWLDSGFASVLSHWFKVNARVDAFTQIVDNEGGLNRFAGLASLFMTTQVVLGLGVATAIKGKGFSLASFTLLLVTVALVFLALQHLFVTSLVRGWGFGFDYARYFFPVDKANEFGLIASICMGASFTLGASLRVFGGDFVGLYPKFAYKAVPRCLLGFLGSYVWFRWVINPASIQAAATQFKLITVTSNPSAALNQTEVQEDAFATIASVTHTFALTLGMVLGHIFSDHVRITNSTVHIRVAVIFALCLVFVTGLSSWFQFAATHQVKFVSAYASLAFDNPATPAASAIASISFGLWFLFGALLNEIQSVPATCIGCVDKAAPHLRRIGGVKVETPEEMAQHELESDVSPALALALTSFAVLLYVADPSLLGMRIGQIQALGTWIANLIPRMWEHYYDNYTKEQIFFLTLPILFLTEVPLTIFTVADLLKLKRLDKYRMHYSKLDAKRPRLYPTNAELRRCLSYHFGNLLGVYTPAFVLGVGGGCYFGIFPYQMTRELPSYWLLELFLSTVVADQLFYWIHRVAHMKQFYAYLHKRHHEWIYSIGLAHHYMDAAEAALFMIPPVLPPMLFGSHIVIVWCTMWFVQIHGILGHSAFCVPFLAHLRLPFLDGRHHDLHHLRFNVNYSAVYDFTDKIWGTFRFEPIIYVEGLNAELACEHNQVKRALAAIKDSDDPFDYEEVKNDKTYVRAKGLDGEGKKIYVEE